MFFLFQRKDEDSKTNNQTDYYMYIEDFKLFKSDGDKIIWILNAKTANMHNKKNKIEFIDLNVNVYTGDEEYLITSDKGLYFIKGEVIELSGNVILTTDKFYKITTEHIKYYTKDEKIKTELPVKITGFNYKTKEKINLDGVGLNGDIKEGVFNVLENVYANIENNMDVVSNYAKLNTKVNEFTFLSDVVANKMGLIINSELLLLSYDKKGEIKELEASKKVKLIIKDKKAICDKALIQNSGKKIVMIGRPEFYVGKDIIVGEKIEFFTDKDEVRVSKVKAEIRSR
jgi:LPS export ABC transporter protein LptC